LLGVPIAAQSRRAVPARLRHALEGCWDLGEGETYEIVSVRDGGLRARWSVGGERYAESMSYASGAGTVEADCGARTQHGQYCVFALDGDAVRVTRVSRRSGRTTPLPATSCHTHVAEPAPVTPPARAIPADAPIAALLAARRREIEASREATGSSDGWTRYGPSVEVRYETGVAMRVRARLAASTCDEALREAGFTPPAGTAPLHRADGCEWPGISPRHRLAPHVAARWSGGVMEIWRTE
jgi:hypothetical protein